MYHLIFFFFFFFFFYKKCNLITRILCFCKPQRCSDLHLVNINTKQVISCSHYLYMGWHSWQSGERVNVTAGQGCCWVRDHWSRQLFDICKRWMFLTGSQGIFQLQCIVLWQESRNKKDLGAVWSRGRVCCATTIHPSIHCQPLIQSRVAGVPQPSCPKYWFSKTPTA